MDEKYINVDLKGYTPKEIATKAIILAYQASKPMGFGYLQEIYNATNQQILSNVVIEDNSVYGDYILGRMVKLNLIWDEKGFIQQYTPNISYQSWANTYKTYEELLSVTIDSFS